MQEDVKRLTETVEAEFAELEAEAARQPGTMDVLRVMGACEQAMQQYDSYMAAFSAPPYFSTTSSSG
jgi:hypothetical protein